jgi:hypothetical protein
MYAGVGQLLSETILQCGDIVGELDPSLTL